MPPQAFEINRLRETIQTRRFGKEFVFLRETTSTNDVARELASKGAPEGVVVIAEMQTAGRGRLQRRWFSPRGGLYFSIVLRPGIKARDAAKLAFVASLAVAEVLKERYGLPVEVKWPNDVLVNAKKICGVLVETEARGEEIGYAIIGIGVNVNIDVEKELPEELRASTTSIMNELGLEVRLDEIFKYILEKLEDLYEEFLRSGFSRILERWKRYAGFLGKTVEVSSGSERLQGLALDIDHEGALIVRLSDGGTRRFLVGEISLRTKPRN